MAARLRSPLVLLAVLSVLSFVARVAWLGEPCTSPCRSPKDHVLIFDEVYYVNAARVIDGIAPPPGNHYVGAPAGDDPNSEHPQLVKLVIAGLMKVFGDGPFAWRIGSVVMGSLAILGMFALALAAGAGRWTALGAAALMASDNLLLVAGRIGTLDIYAVTAMIWAAVLYLRRHPLWAGVVLGVGTACKEVTPYALIVLALLEAARWWQGRSAGADGRDGAPGAVRWALARLAGCVAACAGVFVGLLALMDEIAPPYNYSTGIRLKPGPFHHLAHIFSYGTQLSSPHGPQGIASYPWEWLFDFKPIVYLNINPSQPSPGLFNVHPAVHFLGIISPPMLLPAIPALVLAAGAVRGPGWSIDWLRPPARGGTWALGDAPMVGLAWVLGTLGPFALLSLLLQRTSYLYYMVLVMPGVYLALAGLAVRARTHRRTLIAWVVLIVVALVIMYPLTPLP
ncbi:MAG TPA: glycosyltransferase family 39 protein [Solirubrobacteraceae bacterium]|nr:glycosyltransferase family 39 protein [Solirubrobacteraceae bacterium]